MRAEVFLTLRRRATAPWWLCAWTACGWLLAPNATQAQTLTLQRAMAMAIAANADVTAARAALAEASAQRAAADRGWMPRLTVEEAWQRGDQPVFAFSSLLAQRRFTEADFAVQSLNHPDPISNHRAALLLQQSLFDGGDTRARARAAATADALTVADYRRVEDDTAVAVVAAYGDAMMADAGTRAAHAAIETALHDVARAEQRQETGVVTAADVLSLKVHLAEMQARALLLPHVGFEGGYEWNGATWADRTSAWLVGVRAAWSLSLGGGEAARARAAGHAVERARAQKTSVERAAQVDILAASARLDAARARQDIAIGSVSQARESARIIRERYEAGLAGVTDVLHASDAVLAAESLEITSRVDVLVASAMLDRALGLSPARQPQRELP